ncbi:chromate transporter [Duganella sp. CF402]|uniref:chromate transporter n=1 Tax=unclassified Duganella TaxID=2636909 RepID=UPI0008CE1944|nr:MULTISPECIES: chromate transporter [unclassified Duganella]RZT09935.1 chromate transporter [Duganella sp. BK701]SEL36335.1 chromate transporter [Duganella sp. CF402]
MNEAPLHIVLSFGDWLSLFGHYMLLSLMSIGGAISTTTEMHRYLVVEHHWLTQEQFNNSIAIAQAAPGPNVLFVALMGWNMGLNAGSYTLAFAGVGVTMLGILAPATTLTYMAARWGHQNRELLGVRAFKQGLAPVVVGLMVSVGVILAKAGGNPAADWPLWLVSGLAGLLIWRTRIHLLWLLAAGALVGWFLG